MNNAPKFSRSKKDRSALYIPKRFIQKKAAPKRKRRQIRNSPQQATFIPQCTLDYAHTVINPFTGPMGCLPTQFNIPTLLQRVWVSGEFSSGTAGVGFIAVAPYNMLVNDTGAVIYSDNTYPGGVFVNTTTAGSNSANGNSQFANASFRINAGFNEGRIVGCGLRIRSSSTKYNMGGTAIALCEPNHECLCGMNFATVAANQAARKFVIEDKWVTVCYRPVDAQDYELTSVAFANPVTAVSTSSNSFYMGIMVNTAVVSQPFTYEVFAVTETNGRNVRGMAPRSSDQVGLSAVASAVSDLKPFNTSCEAVEPGIIQRVTNYITTGISHVGNVVNAGTTIANAINTTSQGMAFKNLPRARPLAMKM